MINCDAPGNILYGTATPKLDGANYFRLNSNITYTCESNYKLVGGNVQICQENGNWSTEQPSCQGICAYVSRHNF